MKTKYIIGIIGAIIMIAAVFLVSAATEGQIIGIRAIEHSEFGRTEGANDMEIRTGILVNYVLKVQGGTTYTYTVRQERGEVYAIYNLSQPVTAINDAKVNAIRQYALDTWGFTMSKTAVYYQPYSRGT